MSEEPVRSIVEHFYQCRLANDASQCLAHFGPETTLRIAGSPHASSIASVSSDSGSLRQMIEGLVGAWEWRSQQIESLTIQGDRAAVHYHLEARFIPTGDLVRSELMDLITVRNGKIFSFVEFVDTAHVAQLVAKVGGARAV